MRQPDVSTPARKTAVGFENGIRNDVLESCALIGPDGRMVVSRTGRADQVHLTNAELLHAGQGATLAHNHPRGFGPSLDDVLEGTIMSEGLLVMMTDGSFVRKARHELQPAHKLVFDGPGASRSLDAAQAALDAEIAAAGGIESWKNGAESHKE